jgi:hypothetical protein
MRWCRSKKPEKLLRPSFSVMSGYHPARAVDSTRTQPFVPNSPDVVQLGSRSMTKVSATWNIHEAGPFSES